jgi:bacterioferritin
MDNQTASTDLLALLNRALARELQVSVQYMMQHAVEAGRVSAAPRKAPQTKQITFIASHTFYSLPGPRLKKTAITEMRHAEAIAERIVVLGGTPTAQPDAITIGATASDMLATDLAEEQGAIDLYGRIIEVASGAGDDVTAKMFQAILADERRHYREFSDLLGGV